MENIDDDTDRFGVDFVKINDKKLSKQYNIKHFPTLSYFRLKEPIIYEGQLTITHLIHIIIHKMSKKSIKKKCLISSRR